MHFAADNHFLQQIEPNSPPKTTTPRQADLPGCGLKQQNQAVAFLHSLTHAAQDSAQALHSG
jgi:hypothetical protein